MLILTIAIIIINALLLEHSYWCIAVPFSCFIHAFFVLVSMNKINDDNATVSFYQLTIGVARAIAACIMSE